MRASFVKYSDCKLSIFCESRANMARASRLGKSRQRVAVWIEMAGKKIKCQSPET